ncbi:chloride channel protein [Chryseobacterium sp.]|uniref:chloride channel protein n=1 Tax=Chryseobacterium sp. TaxID=1871047 RepID=UPI0011CC83DD|nr:chloride channel protein [Chryseobacterium sp.]TXF79568.1 chloride channel protein [Chryseobacterium sp.]
MKYKYKRRLVDLKNTFWVRFIIIYFKHLYDRTTEANSSLKKQFLQFLPFLVASFITGLIAYLYSLVFTFSESFAYYLFQQSRYTIFFLTPLSFLVSWYLVRRFAKYSAGSGIPQIMASVDLSKQGTRHLVSNFLSFKVILIKILASAVKVLGGGIAGREGPTIQIAGSVFVEVHRLLPKWWLPVSQKNVMIAGAASGLAAAFNTPLGGIIFAIEELSKFHIKHIKSPLFIAVIIAGLTAQGFGGSYLYLGYPKTEYHGWLVMLGITITAIVSGYFGSKMCDVIIMVMNFFEKFKKNSHQVLIVLLCGFFVAFFIFYFGTEAMGSGKELMERLLFSDNKKVEWYLPFLRMNGLIASFSFGGAGGVFAPSLSSGATFGALIAQFLDLTGQNANILILIGMTGFLTGVTRAPFTSAIIILEMTDRHSIIFLLLVGAILANIVSTLVNKHAFYDLLKDKYIKRVT